MLVPLGGWCKTAYQVRQFLLDKNVRIYSYPYDWTITPFSALQKTLDAKFDPEQVLQPDKLSISKFGSILDEETSLIYHHDFPPDKISDMVNNKGVNSKNVPLRLFDTTLISDARGRFKYTYQNLLRLKESDKKLGFVRWNRRGHPDRQLPGAFEGENLESLSEVVFRFLGHENFSILQIVSEPSGDNFRDGNIIKNYSADKYGAYAVISERKGFDGDGSNNFRGDTKSWNLLLAKFVSDYKIPVANSLMNKLTNKCIGTANKAARKIRRRFS